MKRSKTKTKNLPQVAIIMGSPTDWKAMRAAAQALDQFDIKFSKKIVSAHRTPEYMQKFALDAAAAGYEVIIAGAGGAAHLPGMVASLSTLPVIGVPVAVGKLDGLDALLSIAQMPKGVPVACMAVDNSFNAGLLAARILALKNPSLRKKLAIFRKRMFTKSKAARV